jgi:hypothetical protein
MSVTKSHCFYMEQFCVCGKNLKGKTVFLIVTVQCTAEVHTPTKHMAWPSVHDVTWEIKNCPPIKNAGSYWKLHLLRCFALRWLVNEFTLWEWTEIDPSRPVYSVHQQRLFEEGNKNFVSMIANIFSCWLQSANMAEKQGPLCLTVGPCPHVPFRTV